MFTITIELIYQKYQPIRHNVDYLVHVQLPSIKNQANHTILLGDSVANGAIKTLEMPNGVCDFTSNQAISMAGQYFLLKRYLEQNSAPKEVFLISTYDFYLNNLNQEWTQTYFTSVFMRPEEIQVTQSVKPDLFKKTQKPIDYFSTRRDKLKYLFKSDYQPNIRRPYKAISDPKLRALDKFDDSAITRRTSRLQRLKHTTPNIPVFFLDKIVQLCHKEKIVFSIVIVPMPQAVHRVFKESAWHQKLDLSPINVIDINDYYRYPDSFFQRDGTHIFGRENSYFQFLLDEHVVDLF